MGAVAHYHFSISFSPPSIYYIYYVDPCLFCCSHKDIYVGGLLLPDSFPLSWWDRDVDKSEATVKRRLIQVVFMQRLCVFFVFFSPLAALLLRGLLTKHPRRVDKQGLRWKSNTSSGSKRDICETAPRRRRRFLIHNLPLKQNLASFSKISSLTVVCR